MPREPSYGEIAFTTYHRLKSKEKPPNWDELDPAPKSLWENIAANVLAQYHKRQAALRKQTKLNEPVPDGPGGAMKPRYPVDPLSDADPETHRDY